MVFTNSVLHLGFCPGGGGGGGGGQQPIVYMLNHNLGGAKVQQGEANAPPCPTLSKCTPDLNYVCYFIVVYIHCVLQATVAMSRAVVQL